MSGQLRFTDHLILIIAVLLDAVDLDTSLGDYDPRSLV